MLKLFISPQFQLAEGPPREKTIFNGREVPVPDAALTSFVRLANRSRAIQGVSPFERGIAFGGYWDAADGYGQSAVRLALSLMESGVNVQVYSSSATHYNTVFDSESDALKKAFQERDESVLPDIGVSLSIVEDMHLMPPCPVLVTYTMWETDRFPRGYADLMKQSDRILVPSRFCFQALRASGYDGPLAVSPLPLNPAYYALGEKRKEGPGDPFTFLFVSAPMPRKGLDLLVDAFLKAFEGDGSVRLRIHTRRWARNPNEIELEVLRKIGEDARIQVSTDKLPLPDLLALYAQADCLAHPARGEGFGLTPAQALLAGVPVIATGATGLADFITEDFAWPLSIAGWEQPAEGFYHRDTEGQWTRPSLEHLVELMRYARHHWHEGVDRARKGRKWLWERHNPQSATQSLLAEAETAWRTAKSLA